MKTVFFLLKDTRSRHCLHLLSRNKKMEYLKIDYCHFEHPLIAISVMFQNKYFSFQTNVKQK